MKHAVACAVFVAAAAATAMTGCQSPPVAATPGSPVATPTAGAAERDRATAVRRALAEDLARRYGRSADATRAAVDHAFEAAAATGLDPLLVLAVIGVESRFDPRAANPSGAKGLMQIIPRFHSARLATHGGAEAVLDPAVNIRVGSAILAEYIERAGGETAGLRRYVGAEGPGSAYAGKVLAERARLRAVLPTDTAGAPRDEDD